MLSSDLTITRTMHQNVLNCLNFIRAHSGAELPSSMNLWVSLVCPILSLIRITSTCRLELFDEDHCDMLSLIAKYFLLLARWGENYLSCHLSKINARKGSFKSEWGTLVINASKETVGSRAFLSASSFPWIPTWAGTQQKRTDFYVTKIRNNHYWAFWINGWKELYSFNEVKALIESEYITKLEESELRTRSRAWAMAVSSEVKTEA